MKYINRKKISKIVRHAGVAMTLVVAVLGTLYVGEGVFSREALVPTASAWRCESMTASPNSIIRGESSRLAWKFANDGGVTVTVSGVTGTFSGVVGHVDVSPMETTTYVATARKQGTSQTMTCSVEVKVTEPAPAPDAVCTLTADKTSIEEGESVTLTWTSENAVNAHMNQGVGDIALDDSLVVSPTATTTYIATFKNTDDKEVSCEKTITVTPTPPPVIPAPVCSLSLSSTNVNAGTEVTLSWTSENVDTVNIDNGIGVVATTGLQSVIINNAVTYTGTFVGKNGDVITCTTDATIISSGGESTPPSGGGGPCRNCGGGSTTHHSNSTGSTTTKTVSPNILLSSTVTSAPYVYLSQVPYTGFTAGPILTAVFWISVLMLSALIAYVMTVPRPLAGFTSFARMVVGKKGNKAVTLNAMPMPTHSFAPIVIQPEEYTTHLAREINGMADNGTDDFIEERAQQDHILLSPEALRMVATEAQHSSLDNETLYTTIFDEAKAMYPREDGWILLSKERINAVLAVVKTETPTKSSTDQAQITTPMSHAQISQQVQEETRVPYSAAMTYREAAPKTQSSKVADVAPTVQSVKETPVAEFVTLLESGQQQKVFEILRMLSAQGRAEQYIKSLVRGLDDVYKNRIEGGRTPTAELARATATWSNNDFEAVLGTLIESVDWSYSSARVGTKIALAKVFEYFEGKKA